MSLYEEWKSIAEKDMSQEEYNIFWSTYLEKEKKNYAYILENHEEPVSGSLTEIAEKFGMGEKEMAGFIDGINTSLVKTIDLDTLAEDTQIKLEIDFEKLFFNMLEAKADWLYNLPEWEGVLTEERRLEIRKDFNRTKIAVSSKVGRNDPCPCGSGLKYKKCCGK